MCREEHPLRCVFRSSVWSVSQGAEFEVCLKEQSLKYVVRIIS